MNARKNNSLLTVAGVLFLASAVLYAGWRIAYFFRWSGMLDSIGVAGVLGLFIFPAIQAIIGIGMLAKSKTTAGIGFGIYLALQILSLFSQSYLSSSIINLLLRVLLLVWLVLSVISCFTQGQTSMITAFIAAGALAINELPDLISNAEYLIWSFDFITVLLIFEQIALVAGAFIFALSMRKIAPRNVVSSGASFAPIPAAPGNKADRLATLASLREQGLITQEEFERKKYEIINS